MGSWWKGLYFKTDTPELKSKVSVWGLLAKYPAMCIEQFC